MKVGIITFHWAANYGAILQAYSLVEYLRNQYCANVEIIDYCPSNLELSYKNAIKHIRPNVVWDKIREVQKNKIVSPFRRQLPLSKRYYSNQELICSDMTYDIILTGSDQIWNPWFLLRGEKKITPAYFLDFAGDSVKKISISASFGCSTLPVNCYDIVKPLLERFDDISVRESSGIDILRSLSIDGGTVTADPTALLSRMEYLAMCDSAPSPMIGRVTKMILRRQSKEKKKRISQICANLSENRAYDLDCLSMSEWLTAIRDSAIVVTNSFHCVMMCLKLHTPFVVILEKGSGEGMNDRFFTLLSKFNLRDRILANPDDVKKLSNIDFEKVDVCMEEYAQTLKEYLERNISL